MAARKTKRGRRRNRGRFGFLYVLLSFILICAALAVGSMVFFRVDSIRVTGQNRYSAEEVIAAAGVNAGDNLFRLNKSQMTRRVSGELPYIRSVSFQPHLPSTLTIQVVESRPAAAIQGAEGWFLLDARGKLVELGGGALQSKAAAVTGLTPLAPTVGSWLAVDQAEQGKLNGLIGLLTALESGGLLQNLTSADLSGSSEILFGYGGRFTVQIPLSCDFNYKMQILDYAVQHLEENETGLIDLTRDNAHFIPNETA